MNTALNILRTILVIIITIVVIFSSYFFLVLDGDGTRLPFFEVSQDYEKPRDLTETQREISEYIDELKYVELDVGFFESDAFKGLKDFKKELPILESGRKNPFEPID